MEKTFYTDERLNKAQIRRIRDDLGWASMWTTTVVHSIMLLQRMRNEPQTLPHSEWANHQDPGGDMWVAAVAALPGIA